MDLLNMEYNNMAQNFSEYVLQYWIEWRNGSSQVFSVLDNAYGRMIHCFLFQVLLDFMATNFTTAIHYKFHIVGR